MENPKIHYVIAGEGELEIELKEKVAAWALENIHFLGYRTDVNKLCNAADIFVMPSLQEGLSVALMEAMACGLPIIASRIRGNIDLIDNGKGGLLVDAMDSLKYMEAIEKLIRSPEQYKQMGEYNMNKIKKYSIENVEEQLMPIIRAVDA